METLNLRWEELGIKEAQLKAHIQKFEQFIQVPRGMACCMISPVRWTKPWQRSTKSSPTSFPTKIIPTNN